MLSLATTIYPAHVRPMANDSDDIVEVQLLGAALAALRDSKKISQAKAGEAFGDGGISPQGWGLYEAGKRPGILKPSVQAKLAAAIGMSVFDLHRERDRLRGAGPIDTAVKGWAAQAWGSEFAMLPIREPVQAGAWLAVDDLSQVEPQLYPAARDGRYPTADQWLAQVLGDSVNQLGIFEGDLVHLVDAIDIGYSPRTNDIVQVERLRFGGGMRELTLKQVEVTPDGVLLWPRSNNPRWREPLALRDGVDDEEDIDVRVRALVLASIRRF